MRVSNKLKNKIKELRKAREEIYNNINKRWVKEACFSEQADLIGIGIDIDWCEKQLLLCKD